MKKVYLNTISILLCLLLSGFLSFQKQSFVCCKAEEVVRLQDDFYDAVNYEWKSKIKLNSGTASYGTFQEVSNKVNDDIKSIFDEIEKSSNKYDSNSDEIKILNLYNQYFDLDKRNQLGAEPIKKYLNMADKIDNIKDVKNILCNKNFMYFQFLVNLGVGADCKQSDKNILYISNSKLALGNSYYYRNNDIKSVYRDYLYKINKLSGLSEEASIKYADTFINIEEEFAKGIPTKEEESKDSNRIEKQYNVYSIKELDKSFPNIALSKILKAFNLDKADKIIVENPDNLKCINDFLKESNIDNIKVFFRTGILLRSDNSLNSEFRNASSELKGKLYGAHTSEINRDNSIKFVTCCMDEIVSKLYIEKFFDDESKTNVENISKEIIDNFKERLSSNEWLSNKTKQKAIRKLETLCVKVGYPHRWNDYSKLKIKSYCEHGNLVDNMNNIYMFNIDNEFSKLNKKNDKREWNMAPCTVNAYYNPLNNEIVFPAAILQFPFYDKNNSKEENLGSIGVIIGHEITHAFDNTGCRFDENGDLKNWWGMNDYREFEKRKNNIAKYYDEITTDEQKHMDGNLTVGENISDLGGMACALDLMNKIENPDYEAFFESYARMWREVSTKEMKEFLLKNDCHAPKKVRVNEILSQFEEFYITYNIKEGDKMYVEKAKRMKIW